MEWEPKEAAAKRHGQEITSAQLSRRELLSSHQHDYQKPPLPPRNERPREGWTDRLFQGEGHTNSTFKWPKQAVVPEKPLPLQPAEPAPWPVVSYHGHCPPDEKALRNAVIDKVEEQAWRSEAKVLPERTLYHGEDERKHAGRHEPLSRAGSCFPTRAKEPVRAGGPQWTRNGTGSSYAWPRSGRPAKVTWRQHDKAAKPPPPMLERPAAGTVASQARDFHSTQVAAVLRPESAPATAASSTGTGRPRGGFQLVSAAEWKRRQKEQARVAMPGVAREAARSGTRASLPPGTRGWANPGRGFRTGAGCEPLRMGGAWQKPGLELKDPRAPSAPGVNRWHQIKANSYT